MSEHTPGPWEVITIQREPDYLAAVDGPVAGPEWTFAPQVADGIRSEANACLVAAAPKLLEFVEQTVAFYELMQAVGDLREEERVVLDSARALIVKARGKP